MIRLDKFLTNEGIGSRKDVKDLVKKGRISVNGITAKSPEIKIAPDKDVISLDGKTICYQEFVYFLLNKPKGCVTATEDKNDKTVLDYILEEKHRNLFPVGRLDKDTEGLLLITDDGELSHRLLSPRHHVDKVYIADLKNDITDEDIVAFKAGLDIGEKDLTLPAGLERVETKKARVTICEGKFHQVKRMFEARENKVLSLKRISMGELHLGDLPLGEYRRLTNEELTYVKECKGSAL